jgi:hypothetical protein
MAPRKAIDDGLASLVRPSDRNRNMFLAGRDDSIDAMASRLGVRRDYVAALALSRRRWACRSVTQPVNIDDD